MFDFVAQGLQQFFRIVFGKELPELPAIIFHHADPFDHDIVDLPLTAFIGQPVKQGNLFIVGGDDVAFNFHPALLELGLFVEFDFFTGKETFLKIMRRWAYPDPEMENIKTGAQCRFATTDEFLQIAEDVSGKKLNWYWEVYFRQASLPILNAELKEGILYLTWITENNISFYLPVEVKLGEKIITVSMNEGRGELIIPDGFNPVIDPDKWITMDEVIIVQ